MHRTRLVSALILMPLLILYIMYLPPVFFLFLIMLISMTGQYEFYSIFSVEKKYRVIGLLSGGVVFFLVYTDGSPPADFAAVLFVLVAVIRLFAKKSPDNALRDVSYVLAGVVYVPFLLSYQIKLDRKSTRLNSSHTDISRMPSSA